MDSHAPLKARSTALPAVLTREMAGKLEVGQRLRQARKASKLTLKELSDLSGLAVSTISKAELGQTALSYEKFVALSSALAIDMTRLFVVGDACDTAPPKPTFVKSSIDSVQSYTTAHYAYSLVCGEYPDKIMQPILATINAREATEFNDSIRHAGQEFVIVLSGKVRIQFENGESVVLSRHETAYFDSGMGHIYLSLSKQPAQVVSVCC